MCTGANGLADGVKVALTPDRRRPDRPHVCQMRANATAQVPPSRAFALLGGAAEPRSFHP